MVAINGKQAGKITLMDIPPKGFLTIDPQDEMDFANLFVRESK